MLYLEKIIRWKTSLRPRDWLTASNKPLWKYFAANNKRLRVIHCLAVFCFIAQSEPDANADTEEEEEVEEEVVELTEDDAVYSSMEIPNLETADWIKDQVIFLGPLIYQDTRLGEARHRDTKARKRIVSGRNDWADILRVVRDPIISVRCILSIPLLLDSSPPYDRHSHSRRQPEQNAFICGKGIPDCHQWIVLGIGTSSIR